MIKQKSLRYAHYLIMLVALMVVSCTNRDTNLGAIDTTTPEEVTSAPQMTDTPIPTVVEPGLAYGIPCKPPCWRGLIPGKSTGEEVAQAIEQLRAEGWADRITGNATVGYSVSPSPFTSDGTIHVFIEDNVVTGIHGSSMLSFYYSVGDLVELLGDPELLYLVAKGSTCCRSCEQWSPPSDSRNVPVHILYPSKGLWFLMLVPLDNGLGCICPEMQVTTFIYHAPYTIKEILEGEHPLVVETALKYATEQDIIEWHGFGGY